MLCPAILNTGDNDSMPNRNDAWNLLCEYTKSESLRKHALAVKACARAYARKRGGDLEQWGLAALLHDFDYERWPNAEHPPTQEHPYDGSKILREQGYPKEIIHAILGHANYSGVARTSPLDHILFACRGLHISGEDRSGSSPRVRRQ